MSNSESGEAAAHLPPQVDIGKTLTLITGDEEKKYKHIFFLLDSDNSGALSLEEIENYFTSEEYATIDDENALPTELDVLRAFEEIDINQDGELSLEEFLAFMLRLPTAPKRDVFWIGVEEACEYPAEASPRVLTFREKVWNTFEKPSSSTLAKCIALTLMVLIFISVAGFCIESILAVKKFIDDTGSTVFEDIELVCIIAFSAEYTLRLWSTPKRVAFVFEFMNLVDLIAILPFYIEVVVKIKEKNTVGTEGEEGQSSGAVIRVVRLIRVFRMFKFSKYLEGLQMMSSALKKSALPLGMAAFITFITTVFFSSLVFFFEKGDMWDAEKLVWVSEKTQMIELLNASSVQEATLANESIISVIAAGGQIKHFVPRNVMVASPFWSIPHTMYWCVVTMTTVGYGDVAPSTSLGQLVGICTMFAGIVLLAIPISVFGANFQQEMEKARKAKIKKRQERKARKNIKRFKLEQAKREASFKTESKISTRNELRLKEVQEKLDVAVEAMRKRVWIDVLKLHRKHRNKLLLRMKELYETKWMVDEDTTSLSSRSPSASPHLRSGSLEASSRMDEVSDISHVPSPKLQRPSSGGPLYNESMLAIESTLKRASTRRFRNALASMDTGTPMRVQSIDSSITE